MTLAILFSLKTMESLQNGVATYFQLIPLISMRTESQALSLSCRSVDADAWCKWSLKRQHAKGTKILEKISAKCRDYKSIYEKIFVIQAKSDKNSVVLST